MAAGANPMALKRGIESGRRRGRRPLEADRGGLRQGGHRPRGHISSRDRAVGDVIADAIEKVGKTASVNVEEGKTFGVYPSSPRACSSTRATYPRT